VQVVTVRLGGYIVKKKEREWTEWLEEMIVISYLKVHSKEREPSSSINDASSIGYIFLI
jgi:hypothetical protein